LSKNLADEGGGWWRRGLGDRGLQLQGGKKELQSHLPGERAVTCPEKGGSAGGLHEGGREGDFEFDTRRRVRVDLEAGLDR